MKVNRGRVWNRVRDVPGPYQADLHPHPPYFLCNCETVNFTTPQPAAVTGSAEAALTIFRIESITRSGWSR
jgi:hypothetical protein